MVLNHTLKDKPSLFTPTSFNLADMSNLQKWLVACCGASQYWAQGPEKLADVMTQARTFHQQISSGKCELFELGLRGLARLFSPAGYLTASPEARAI